MAVDLAGGTAPSIDIAGPISVTKNRGVMTGMFWVNIDAHGAADRKFFSYSIGTGSTTTRFGAQQVTATPGQPRVGGRALDTDTNRFLNSATVISTGVWHHIAVVIDYGAATGKIYIDGVLDTSGALSGAFGAAQTANTDTQDARLGGREGSLDQVMDGRLEFFCLYSRELSLEEILTHYTTRGRLYPVFGILHSYVLAELAPAAAFAVGVPINDGERINALPINGALTYGEGIARPRRRIA